MTSKTDTTETEKPRRPLVARLAHGPWTRPLAVGLLTVKRFAKHNGSVYAGNMAFLAMLSLFPFLIFLTALSGFLGRTDAGLEVISLALEQLPPEVSSTLEAPIQSVINGARGGLLTIGALMALWTAGNGFEAARLAVVRSRGMAGAGSKPMWKRRLETLALVGGTALAAIIAMSSLVLLPPFLELLENYFAIPKSVFGWLSWVRFFVAPLILLAAIMVLYKVYGPRGMRAKSRVLPGALVCLLMVLACGTGFSLFLQHAGNYNVTYGGLSGIVLTQLFFYLMALGFTFGAELNAVLTTATKRPGRPVSPTSSD